MDNFPDRPDWQKEIELRNCIQICKSAGLNINSTFKKLGYFKYFKKQLRKYKLKRILK